MGFLNWCEIDHMYNSGLMDFQSHTMSHNWYFVETEIIDFFKTKSKEYIKIGFSGRF